MPSPQAMTHVAWNCDGKKLAAVGIDKITRVWAPEKSVNLKAVLIQSVCFLMLPFRWSRGPLPCSQVGMPKKWTTYRGIRRTRICSVLLVRKIAGSFFGMLDVCCLFFLKFSFAFADTTYRKSTHPTMLSQGVARTDKLLPRRSCPPICVRRSPVILPDSRKRRRGCQRAVAFL